MIQTFRSSQKGQALPLGIAFIASSILFAIVLFNTGQTASEKSRITNTADAAAYSGLIWQARALNFQAYTNRAMVANQVSIGQMVSLTSWTKYAYILARNIDYIGYVFPVVKPYTATAKRITETIDDVIVVVADTFIPIVDTVNNVLSQSQRAIYLASFAATPAIVQEVVEKNDQRYSVSSAYALVGMGENAYRWNDFATRYNDRDGMMRKMNVVNRSKDEFTNARNLRTGQILPGAPNVLDLGLIKFWLRKEGTTHLVVEEDDSSSGNSLLSGGNNTNNLKWEWKGKDALSFHIKSWGCSWHGCGWDHDEVPLGWGSRYVNGDYECSETGLAWLFGGEVCTRYLNQNSRGERYADMEREELDVEYQGLRAYYDLSDLRPNNKDPRLALNIQVELPESEIRTASKIDGIGSSAVPETQSGNGLGQGVFGTEDQMAGNGMVAIASGELYFHPPDDYLPSARTGQHEIASLFSPYWEVRLTKTPMTRRFMAWALRDTGLITQSAAGVEDGVQRFVSDKTEELERLLRLRERLESQLASISDQSVRARIQQQLSAVTSQIVQVESLDVNVDEITGGLRGELTQGYTDMVHTNVSHYENLLNDYATQQGEEMVNQFQDQIVDQVTDEMEQALEDAMQNAVEDAVTSFL